MTDMGMETEVNNDFYLAIYRTFVSSGMGFIIISNCEFIIIIIPWWFRLQLGSN